MWKTDECGSWLKSPDTLGWSVKPRMPLSCCSAARLIAPLPAMPQLGGLMQHLN